MTDDIRKLDISKVKLPKEVLEGLMDSGKLRQYHLYEFNDVLRPRGHMKKESVGVTLLEKLKDYYESWTDPKYADSENMDESTLLKILQKNLMEETHGAWREFLRFVNSKEIEHV